MRRLVLSSLLIVIMLILGCPKPPDPPTPPVIADCEAGYMPCEDDSTVCCEITCPQGFELNAEGDSCEMAVTSNNFSWTSSRLVPTTPWAIYDLEMIDENDVWIVGHMSHPDSNRLDTMHITPETPLELLYANDGKFNAAHWDGQEWRLIDIFTLDYQGRINWQAIRAVSVITHDDIRFFSESGGISKWYGGNVIPGYFTTVWDAVSLNSDEIWFSGPGGLAGRWLGNEFELFSEPGLSTNNFMYLTAPKGGSTLNTKVWMAGWKSSKSTIEDSNEFWHFDGNSWNIIWDKQTTLFEDTTVYGISTAWASDEEWIVTAVRGSIQPADDFLAIHKQDNFKDHQILTRYSNGRAITVIRGNGVNDFFIYGYDHPPRHWNGESLTTFSEVWSGDGLHSAMDFKGNHVFVADSRGYVYHGKR